MPNIAVVLREEISRLSRKEARSQIGSAKKAANQHRRDIAELKRQVASLQSQVKRLLRMQSRSSGNESVAADGTKTRFVAKGLRSMRARLGLSASELGTLVGVSAQSIYNWESGDTRPRDEQIARLVALRGVGKRAIRARLDEARPQKRERRKQ